MDNNLGSIPRSATPLPVRPQVPQNKPNLGRILLMIVSAVLIVVVLVGIGYMLFLNYSSQNKPHSAQVYNQQEMIPPIATPQPTNYQINPKDTTNQAIEQDTQAINQNLNGVNNDLNNVDNSFNDQQTNLQ